MANIFKQSQDVNNHPNRNNFNLRYQNHLTMKLGGIYPFMCKEVVPGDSFKIDTAFGLKFMPLVFPVQSHLRAHVSYFYVPSRIVWPNHKNFISGVESHEHPYIKQPASFFSTGSLSDYLDVPTTTVGVNRRSITQLSGSSINARISATHDNTVVQNFLECSFIDSRYVAVGTNFTSVAQRYVQASGDEYLTLYHYDVPLKRLINLTDDGLNTEFRFGIAGTPLDTNAQVNCTLMFWASHRPNLPLGQLFNDQPRDTVISSQLANCVAVSIGNLVPHNNRFVKFVPNSDSDFSSILDALGRLQDLDAPLSPNNIFVSFVLTGDTSSFQRYGEQTLKTSVTMPNGSIQYDYRNESVSDSDVIPFASVNGAAPRLPISAIPYRCYEMVCNAYFRNDVVDPLRSSVTGDVLYNTYLENTGDGADTFDYHLHYRNYELDFLTSCMPSPQFGNAPLVGMSALGELTIEDENGITTAQAEFDSDGNVSKVVLTSPAASNQHARMALNIAQVGMNINDLRSTNAFQRYLENFMRKMSTKYKDFVESHFGVSPRHMELDMPEYIGGVSQDVSVNTVSNMTAGQIVDNKSVPLGEFAGSANCFGQTRNTVTKYCDDYGFILGVITIVPDPAYSQLLPKHYLHSKPLDYYSPEFSQIGMQPITYKEVTPITAYIDELNGDGVLEDTFGYQRPNYDLVSYTDQVHGLFRTELKDFLIHRIFGRRPELGSNFVHIKPIEVNNIFANMNSDDDTIVGQIIVDINASRPVPRIVIPSLQ